MTPPAAKKRQSAKCDPVRAAAVDALMAIEQGAQTEEAISRAIKGRKFSPLDIRFLLQLVNGTTKMRRRLDHEIKFYLARPSIPLSRPVANILRLGFYQIVFTDRVPDAAAVSEAVNLARVFTDERQSKLVNAVLRSRLREPEKVRFIDKAEDTARYLANYYSYPDHFVQYCISEFGPKKAEHLLGVYNRPPFATYRVNHLKAKPDEVSATLTEHEVAHLPGKYLPEFLSLESSGLPLEPELIASGKVYVQDESSGLPVRLLNPRQGQNVVDLTAAPGGKATYCAIRMRNKGRVTAIDKSHQRLEMLVQNAERLGINIIAPVVSDMAEFESKPFDRVLLDPPCSGWGTARKHADLRWSKTTRDVENLTKIQAKMIDRAARLVKPGGVLVYSTCTIIRDENDQVVEEFLLRNQDFSIDPADKYFPKELVSERGFVKTYPGFDDLDGAFAARLVRKQ
ncbi:16S rRNA (cytosine(967)-C(5))-methyltransferase RsmB [candidate division GN15 bacterium]|nr:16S rRNA (cytosine(967)-C(5))-methyltransferase RsmB [candidate division GN15 bacterium]